MARKKRESHVIPTQLEVLLEQYVQARIADHEKGGGDPESYAEIELHLLEARTDLREYLQVIAKLANGQVVIEGVPTRQVQEDLLRFPQTTL